MPESVFALHPPLGSSKFPRVPLEGSFPEHTIGNCGGSVSRPWLTIVAVTLALCAALLYAPLTAQAESRASLTGTLRAPGGKALGGVQLLASVEPTTEELLALPAGAEVRNVPIGTATTTASGQFRLRITNVEAVNEATDAEGLVSVFLTAETPEGQLFHRLQMPNPGSGQLRVQQDNPAAVALDLVTTQVTPDQKPDAKAAAFSAAATNREVRTDRPAYRGTPGDRDGDIWCQGNHWYLKKSRDVVNRNVALMDQATGSRTTGSFSYATTKATSLEIGVTNRAGKLTTTLGMTKGKTTEASVEAPIGRRTKAQWWVGYTFNIYDVMCDNNSGTTWWSGYSEYRPKKFNGNASRRSWKPFKCKSANSRALGPGFTATVSKGRTATKSAAFKMGDGTLRASQSWGSSQTVRFHAKDDTTSYALCGSNGIWSDGVSRVRQV